MSKSLIKYLIAGVAAIAIAAAAFAIGKSDSDKGSNQFGRNGSDHGMQMGYGMRGHHDDHGGQGGMMPPPGMGQAATAKETKKVSAAATKKYPGTIERVMKLQDGSFIAHVISKDGSGEKHVPVTAKFKALTALSNPGMRGSMPNH